MKEKIIIDTDIGDDIDDALAIALALKSPEIDLKGITTVYKNTVLRAKIASRLLKTMCRMDIPVVVGIGKPLINDVDLNEVPCQYTNDMDIETISYNGDAVDFIIDKVTTSNGEISIVPIGPLTNIAAVLIKKPEIKQMIKKIVLMGGSYYKYENEYNIGCDPEAARIVFESGIEIVGVGLDVTQKCILSQDDIEKIKNHGTSVSDLLHKLITLWNRENLRLHDPLAVAVSFDESFVKLEKSMVKIETKGEFSRGMTFNPSPLNVIWDGRDIKSNIRVCSDVDSSRFVKLFMERILS